MTRVVAFRVDRVRVRHYVMGDVDLERMCQRKEVDEKRAEQPGTQEGEHGKRVDAGYLYLFVSCV